MGVLQVFLQLVDPRHGPGEVILRLLGQGTQLRPDLGHITGKGVIRLNLLPDAIRFRADLGTDGGQLQFHRLVCILRRWGIVGCPVAFLQLGPMDREVFRRRHSRRRTLDQDISVVRIILRSIPGGVLRHKGGVDDFRSR